MILFSICTSSTGLRTLLIIKILLQVICTIIPLVIIYRAFSVSFNSVIDGGEKAKKDLTNIFKSFIAGLIIFLIPIIINYTFNSLIGTGNDFVSCINNASLEGVLAAETKEQQEAADKKKQEAEEAQKINKEMQEKRKKDIEEAAKKRAEQGDRRSSKNLDFSCKSDVVKAQFSCRTLKIVEKHLYDLNYNNFRSVIASYGGFDKYAKSLGGVFAEYYGKELNIETETEFQKVAEYTFGWMYMYGMDYYNGGGDYHNWGVGYGQGGHSDDAFYPGNARASKPTSYFDQNFDEVISGTGVNTDLRMATECGPAAQAPLYKGGVLKKGQNPERTFITSFKDLRPGDIMHFFDHPVNRADRSTWGQGRHVAIVGEVYDDRIVIYDGGSYFQTHKDYKRTIKMVNDEASEYAEIRREFGFPYWASERFKTLKR